MQGRPKVERTTKSSVKEKPNVVCSSKADIWALGIILFNIAVIELPWHKAQPSDEIFGEYLFRNRDILLSRSMISEEFNDVLKSIFRVDPIYRASIPEIRAGIRAIKTFYNKSDPRFQKRYERALKARAVTEEVRRTPILSSSEISNSESSVSASIPSFEAAAPVAVAPQNVVSKQLVVTNPDNKPAKPPTHSSKVVQNNVFVDISKYTFTFVHGGLNNAPAFYNSSDSSDGPITPEQPAADEGEVATALENINAIANLDLTDGLCKVAIALPPPVYDQGRALASDEDVCEETRQEQSNTKAKSTFNMMSSPDRMSIGQHSPMIISSVAHLLRFPENVL